MSNRVIPAGSINPNAQLAPGVLVLESLLAGGVAGVATNSIGVDGTGTWGPVNKRVNVASNADYQQYFGGIEPYTVANAYLDMGTFIAAGMLQGVSANYVCVRVTDGTDVMASSALLDVNVTTGVLLTALYSGTTGNTLQASIALGSVTNSYNITLARPGYVAEIYNNISAAAGPIQFWTNVISAINNGQSGVRGPSQLAIASVANGVNAVTMTNNGSAYSSASVGFSGGGGTGATADAVLGLAISSVSVTIPGSYASVPTLSATLGTGAVLVPSLGALSNVPATAQSGSGSYAPADTITLTGGTFATATVLTVTHTKVVSATIAAAGTGGTPGTQTVTGTTGTGTKFQASVTVSGGGVITAILAITVAGDYTVNPTVLTAEPVTGAGLTGAQLSIKTGVLTATISTAGSYTVLPGNPVAQGSTSGAGTGFTATISTWKLVSIAVSSGGGNYESGVSGSQLSITGGGSTGGGAGTLALASTGTVKRIAITASGDDYTSAPLVTISGDGTGAAGTAVIGSSALPAPGQYNFTGGTSGNTGVTPVMQVGTDGSNPTGMYVFRGSGVNYFALVGNSDSTTFVEQDVLAAQTGSQAILTGPPGQSVDDVISVKSGAGLADNSIVSMLGNWNYFLDVTNGGVTRLISPQGYYGGLMGNLSPEQSSLNKPIFTLGTQNSIAGVSLSDQDIIDLQSNGIEAIDRPSPGGVYFSPQTGRSGGYDTTTNFVNIQRMANFIGWSIGKSGVIGRIIGELQDDELRTQALNAIDSFLLNLISSGQIKARKVILNDSNNPENRVVLGFMEAQVEVQLFSVVVVFLVNLRVGTVAISSITPAAQ